MKCTAKVRLRLDDKLQDAISDIMNTSDSGLSGIKPDLKKTINKIHAVQNELIGGI